jgi:hypothetical protein
MDRANSVVSELIENYSTVYASVLSIRAAAAADTSQSPPPASISPALSSSQSSVASSSPTSPLIIRNLASPTAMMRTLVPEKVEKCERVCYNFYF